MGAAVDCSSTAAAPQLQEFGSHGGPQELGFWPERQAATVQQGKQLDAVAAGDLQSSAVAVATAPLSPATSESGDMLAPSKTDAASSDEPQPSESSSDAKPTDR